MGLPQFIKLQLKSKVIRINATFSRTYLETLTVNSVLYIRDCINNRKLSFVVRIGDIDQRGDFYANVTRISSTVNN